MTWDDIQDILFDGSQNEIENVKCPECGGNIHHSYNHTTRTLTIRCLNCGYVSRSNSCESVPNCAKLIK